MFVNTHEWMCAIDVDDDDIEDYNNKKKDGLSEAGRKIDL